MSESFKNHEICIFLIRANWCLNNLDSKFFNLFSQVRKQYYSGTGTETMFFVPQVHFGIFGIFEVTLKAFCQKKQ